MRNYSDLIFFNKEINIIASSAGSPEPEESKKSEQGTIELVFSPESGSLVDNVPSVVAFIAGDAVG